MWFATWKRSLKYCNKCLWIIIWLHYCLISLKLSSLGEISSRWLFQCAHVLSFAESQVSACALILCTILGHPRRRGRGNRHPKTARPCEALGITPGHPTMQWSGCDHYCQLSGWACCSPVETTSRSAWCSLGNRGTLVMWGIASIGFGSTYTKNDYLG